MQGGHRLTAIKLSSSVNHVEFLLFIYLKCKAKKSKTYRKLTMPNGRIIPTPSKATR
jgi:hypothetical protein